MNCLLLFGVLNTDKIEVGRSRFAHQLSIKINLFKVIFNYLQIDIFFSLNFLKLMTWFPFLLRILKKTHS